MTAVIKAKGRHAKLLLLLYVNKDCLLVSFCYLPNKSFSVLNKSFLFLIYSNSLVFK